MITERPVYIIEPIPGRWPWKLATACTIIALLIGAAIYHFTH